MPGKYRAHRQVLVVFVPAVIDPAGGCGLTPQRTRQKVSINLKTLKLQIGAFGSSASQSGLSK